MVLATQMFIVLSASGLHLSMHIHATSTTYHSTTTQGSYSFLHTCGDCRKILYSLFIFTNLQCPKSVFSDTHTHAANEDYMELEMDVLIPAQIDSAVVEIQLGPDDILPGEDKVFEVYLGAAPGTFLSPITYTIVTITDPDPPLPGTYILCHCVWNMGRLDLLMPHTHAQ